MGFCLVKEFSRDYTAPMSRVKRLLLTGWHPLIGVSHPLTISRVVQDIKWISACRLNQRRKSSGPLWQHQFWDRLVRPEKEFGHRLAHMHLNPVRKGLVKHPEEWKWSSYNNLALDQSRVARCPIRIDCVDFPM